MLPISGNIKTVPSKIYESPLGKKGHIRSIYFNNTENTNWTIEVYLYNKTSRVNGLMYSYNLLAGQMLTSSDEYVLDNGNYLVAKSNVSTVTFVINGVEV